MNRFLRLLVLVASLVPLHVLAQAPGIPSDMSRWQAVFKAVDEKNRPKVMAGDFDAYLAAIREAVKTDDWVSQLVAGDALYPISPAAAIPFHEAAAKLAPGEGLPQLELAYDYQRTGQCEQAITAWQAADRLQWVRGSVNAVAAYCFFQAARIDEALDLWDRVPWPSGRRAVDVALSEMALGGRAIGVHIRAMALARGGDERAFRTLVANALDWRLDWWNTGFNPEAFDAVRALAKTVRPLDGRLHRELDCAQEATPAQDAQALLGVLRRCRLLIEGGELPASSAVAKYLLTRLDALRAVATDDLLRRHGAALDARARSEEGDLAALEMLAYLQVRARDYDGLAASDELGWKRYRVAKFAASRVAGTMRGKQDWDAPILALLEQAVKDFPQDAFLHRLRGQGPLPPVGERERPALEWLLAEYAGLSAGPMDLGIPSSRTLGSLVYTLRKLREDRVKSPS
jgi:tetratricopeptide (TPR) repeat protein